MPSAFFSTKADGMGIGLGLCRSIVESHQGRIKAENLYNGSLVVGCRFAFTIPVTITSEHLCADTSQGNAGSAQRTEPTTP